jgi:hypothetical protein
LLTSVGAVAPTIAVLDKTGAAEDGSVVPKVIAATRPITIARFELPIILSFRFAFQDSRNFSSANRACRAEIIGNRNGCQRAFRAEWMPVSRPEGALITRIQSAFKGKPGFHLC